MSLIVGLMRSLSGFLPSATRYGAVCCTCGAAGGVCSVLFQFDLASAIVIGFALPIGPTVWYFNSRACLERDLRLWKRWLDNRWISAARYDQLTQLTVDSISQRWYGRPAGGAAPAAENPTAGAPDGAPAIPSEATPSNAPAPTTPPTPISPPQNGVGVGTTVVAGSGTPPTEQSTTGRGRKPKAD